MDNQIYARTDAGINSFYAKVYGYMGMGVGLSALVSFLLLFIYPQHIINVMMSGGSLMFLLLMGLELGLVIFASGAAAKNSPMALPLFLTYSVVNGYTMSFILATHTQTAVFQALLSASIMFMVMAVIGRVTKRDLSGIGRACIAAVWGILIVSLVNFFLQSSAVDYVVSVVGVVVFAGLIAWDNQRIRLVYEESNGNVPRGWAISLALQLYLDFINLFLFLLRLFRGSRN